jgi:uncharacterized membrane protein YjgN (DUF898 family)
MNLLAPVAAAPRPVRMRFSGKEGDLFRILLRGSLLQIPTFGFYRFWLLTDIRRHLWSHTEIGDDRFEYTGRGGELLIGFLMALAILVPVYLVYFIIALEVERLQAFASIPMFLVLYVLGYYAVYRARRYRATRTIFRGVRFWMTGSGWAYLGRGIVWDLLTLTTLGFAYAWRAAALERYKMENTSYGSLQGSFVADGWTLFKRGAWIWAIYLAVAAVAGVLLAIQDWISAAMLGLALVIGGFFLLPIFRAIELRWWLEGVRFGLVTVDCDLRVGQVVWCYVKTVLISMAYSAVGGIAVGIVVGIFVGLFVAFGTGGELSPAAAIPASIAGAFVYIAFLLGFDIIRRLFLDRGVWEVAVQSATLANLETVDLAVAAAGEVPSGVGEGLLDALDMGGGF